MLILLYTDFYPHPPKKFEKLFFIIKCSSFILKLYSENPYRFQSVVDETYVENDPLQPFNSFESPHDETNKMACAPSEDSDQPGHPPSLIRVLAVRMKKAWVLSYPLSAQRILWSDLVDAQADLSLRWAQSFCWLCHVAVHFFKFSDWDALDSRCEVTCSPVPVPVFLWDRLLCSISLKPSSDF